MDTKQMIEQTLERAQDFLLHAAQLPEERFGVKRCSSFHDTKAFPDMCLPATYNAVSYTHLDVYKRQTIFLTSHFMDEVEVLCDCICILKKGKTVFYGTVADAVKESPCLLYTSRCV